MGLFSKKPKPAPPDTSTAPVPPAADSAAPGPYLTAPAAAQPITGSLPTLQAPAPLDPPPKPAKRSKTKKGTVDPVDFLALRSELMELKRRLEASEQAKAVVESRLAALDATTTALATERPAGGDDVRNRLAELQSQLVTVAEAAAAAAADAEHANAAAAAASEAAANHTSPSADTPAAEPSPAAPAAIDPELLARIDALAAELEAVKSAPPPEPAPAAEPSSEPYVDVETQERVDRLAERMGALDSFAAQLSQLNARVTAQAEFGAQLGSLRDRIAELSGEQDDRRAAAFAATGDAELRDRLNALDDRVTANEGLAAQIAQLAERVAATDLSARQSAEQVAAIEQRLGSISTELANQMSELGTDIDELAAERAAVSQGGLSEAALSELKHAQVKLAAEQARYEIAFREDLATLAEQVRRPAR